MKNKKAIALFLSITLVLSCICYYVRIVGGDRAAGMVSILMFCPTIAAAIVHFVYYRKEKSVGMSKCGLIYIAGAVLVPVIYLGLSYGAYWLTMSESFSSAAFKTSAGTLFLLIPSALVTAAGEEIGWRGFLLPKMAEVWNMKAAVLISGLIWALWHFPLMIAGVYQAGTPLWYQLPVFTIEVLAMTAIMGILRMKSKSVWPAIVLHASHNYFNQTIFTPLTHGESSRYFVGETGIITAVLICVIAIILAKKVKITV